MTKINDGGQAFPSTYSAMEFDELVNRSDHGMSLRDYLAAHAPISVGDAVPTYRRHPAFHDEADRLAFLRCWAKLRYEYADAMIAAGQDT